jgi:hypothetical protein
MKKFLTNMLSSPEGSVSSKRVIGFMGFVFLAGTMTANSFSPVEVAPSAELVEAVKFITAAALFGNTVEKFAGKMGGSNDSQAGE